MNIYIFDMHPFAGALPIYFGMLRTEVHALLGAPNVSGPVWDGSGTCDNWNATWMNIGYDNTGAVNHVGFGPRGRLRLLLTGKVLWSEEEHSDPNPILLLRDPAPVEAVGFLVFTRLGVTTTGYHDDDVGQRAVTVYPRGKWDEMLKESGTVADLSRYRQ